VVNYLLTQFPPKAAVVLISDRLTAAHTPTLAATHQETLGTYFQYPSPVKGSYRAAPSDRTSSRQHGRSKTLPRQGVVSILPASHIVYQAVSLLSSSIHHTRFVSGMQISGSLSHAPRPCLCDWFCPRSIVRPVVFLAKLSTQGPCDKPLEQSRCRHINA
jgi:hypothetical protein